MGRMAEQPPQAERMVRRYGMGSMLAVLSLPIAWLMAALGMNGWQQSALRAMEKDTIALRALGYRIATTDEGAIPALGVVYYVVTYELVGGDRGHR
jgi:hypothetical protein